MSSAGKGGLLLACIVLNSVALKPRRDVYGNSWVVHVEKEKRFVDALAERNGFINRGEIAGFSGHYLLEHKTLGRRRFRRDAAEHTGNLLREPHVKFALQQKILRRTKRGYFLDPYYKDQWYLNNSGVLSVASNFSPESLSYRGSAVTDRRLDFAGICFEGETFTQPLENTKGVVSI